MGHRSGRGHAAAASSRSPSPRSCCRSAAGSTAASSGRCAVSEYLVERMMRGGARQDLLRHLAGQVRHPRVLRRRLRRRARSPMSCSRAPSGLCDAIFRAAAAGRAATSRCSSACPTRSGFPPTRSPRCRTTGCRSCCSRSSGRELFDAVVIDEDGRVLRDPGEAARTRRRTGSGARSRCRAACLPSCTRSGSARERARRVYRHAGQRLARAGRRGASGVQRGRALCRCRHAQRLPRGDRACSASRRDRGAPDAGRARRPDAAATVRHEARRRSHA